MMVALERIRVLDEIRWAYGWSSEHVAGGHETAPSHRTPPQHQRTQSL